MISNNILLEVIHKDKFNRGKYKTPKISILDTIKEKKPLIHRFSKRTSVIIFILYKSFYKIDA